MKLIGVGLCLIGIGIIGYDVIKLTRSSRAQRWIPKRKSASPYSSEKWEFPED